MTRRLFIVMACALLAACSTAPRDGATAGSARYDVVVIGGTPGGVACAVRAAREGLSVLLVERTGHLGGMLTNGLCQWDALSDALRSPIFNETALGMEDHYRRTYGEDSKQFKAAQFTQKHYPLGLFEPKVAEAVVTKLVTDQPRITRLDGYIPVAVDRRGAMVRSVTLRKYRGAQARTVAADVFVDATYEGDLAALAGAPYAVGREARSQYNEPHAGVVFTNITPKPSPDDAVAGRLNIRPYGQRQGSIDPNSPFTADRNINAFNWRPALTNDPNNRRPVEKPANYNREEYVHYERKSMGAGAINGKSTFNAPILPGENTDYPEADWETREKIIKRHVDFGLGLIYFLQNDESVSPAGRARFQQIGLPLDEWTDNGNMPYEIYIRESRRIVGRHVFTEHDNTPTTSGGRTPVHADSIAITDWYMDSHSCTNGSSPGYKYDGKLILTEESRPAQVPYRTILPRGIDNLLVPQCLSASHVAWGAIRLEPVAMQIGEAAGFAAAIAKKRGVAPANIDPHELVRTLIDNGFMVSFFNDADTRQKQPWFKAAQYLATRGYFKTYDVNPDKPLGADAAAKWAAMTEKSAPAAAARLRANPQMGHGEACILVYNALIGAGK